VDRAVRRRVSKSYSNREDECVIDATHPHTRTRLTPEGGAWIWDPATGRFDGPRLRLAIVVRGWTLPEFASACRPRLSMTTLHNALDGKRCLESTVIRILQTLTTRDPVLAF
jgi:hypothetical protein